MSQGFSFRNVLGFSFTAPQIILQSFIDVWKCSPESDICVLFNKLYIIGQDPYISFLGTIPNIYEKQAYSVECGVDIYLWLTQWRCGDIE